MITKRKQRLPGSVVLSLAASLLVSTCAIASDSSNNPPPSEQKWIEDFIGRDVAEIVLFSANKANAPSVSLDSIQCLTRDFSNGTIDYTLTYSSSKSPETISLKKGVFIWSPAAYAPWAAQLISKFSLQPGSDSTVADSDFISMLSRFDSGDIFRQNNRLSQELGNSPLSASLQEQSALLCAVMALRECASAFSDLRPELSRICAHLAIAKAVRGDKDYSDSGKLAEIVLTTLSGRAVESLSLIDKLQAVNKDDSVASWCRALKIRTTHDQRIAQLKNASLLEELEYGRALVANLSTNRLTDFIESRKKVSSLKSGPKDGAKINAPADSSEDDNIEDASLARIDFVRLAFRGLNSVQAGHMYAEPGVGLELADYLKDYRRYHKSTAGDTTTTSHPTAEMLADLNKNNVRCLVKESNWQLEPVSWSDVAAFHRRHVLDAIWQKYRFEKIYWAVDEQAQSTYDRAKQQFSFIDTFPLCDGSMLSMRLKDSHVIQPSQDFLTQFGDMVQKYPQLCTFNIWYGIRDNFKTPAAIPATNTWFIPDRILYGTTFEIEDRDPYKDRLPGETISALYELNPYSRILDENYAENKYGKEPTSDQYAACFKGINDFDMWAQDTVVTASKKDPTKYIAALVKMAALEPNSYFALSRAYADANENEKAAAAAETGLKLSHDAVLKSNSSAWLAHYYLDKGDKARALELATNAADTGSGEGLATLGWIYDRLGQIPKAEDEFKEETERYGHYDDLCQFYIRHSKENPTYKKHALELLKMVYPNVSEQSMSVLASTTPPTSGIIFTKDDAALIKHNLAKGDIIVAVRGYRINNTREYLFIRDADRTPNLEFIAWHGGQYHAFKVSLPGRSFGCPVSDYPIPPAQAAK